MNDRDIETSEGKFIDSFIITVSPTLYIVCSAARDTKVFTCIYRLDSSFNNCNKIFILIIAFVQKSIISFICY